MTPFEISVDGGILPAFFGSGDGLKSLVTHVSRENPRDSYPIVRRGTE